ncbi:MAG: DUF4258 domain-containing protein [Anaerolineae bacterium]
MPPQDILFRVKTPLGFSVYVSVTYWHVITTIKHPVIAGREASVQDTLAHPDKAPVSRSDSAVYLFYKLERPGRWICAVAKRLDGEAFLITAYPTDAIKEGARIWPK